MRKTNLIGNGTKKRSIKGENAGNNSGYFFNWAYFNSPSDQLIQY